MIAEPTHWNGERWRTAISGLRYGVTVRTLNSGKWTRSIVANNAYSRACARVMGSYW
jgi:hypothetical protein